ncbi:uncharacterized protein LOC132277781 [Cornus florida]|uniref:uncharacterized protein LOC132277781 n=1 Tax=Cornus florida TaxID=4283 RepID=UPI00289A1757|nr:uncharacterized protein LOC132277781 [Cornus florida]
MTWEVFQGLFYEKYFPRTAMREMRKKFDGLYQGSMSVMEYKNKFTSLSRYVPDLVQIDEDRALKFQDGLHLDIRPRVSVLDLRVYSEVVRRALLVEAEDRDSQRMKESKKHFRGEVSSSGSQLKKFRGGGGSLYSQGSRCGQTGHFKRECPQRGSGSRGGMGSQYKQSQSSVIQSGSRVPQTLQPAASAGTSVGPSVVRGVSYSFISSSFAYSLGLEITSLDGVLCVDTPVGGPVTLDRICRGYAIEIAGRTLWFDFIPLKMMGFDIILGIDWLSFFRATIDCFRGRVTVCTPNGDWFCFMGDRSDSHTLTVYGHHRLYLASLLAEEE